MNTLKFNDADLKANREGRLSDAQAKRFDIEVDRLQVQRKYSLWSGVTVFSLAFIAMVIIAALMSGIVIVQYAFNGDQDSARLSSTVIVSVLVMILILVVSLLIFIVFLINYALRIHSLTSAPIRSIEGQAEVFYFSASNPEEDNKPGNRLILHTSRYSLFTFNFDKPESLRPFENGLYYRVYYLPYAEPQALSAEEIEPEKAKR